MTKTRSLVLCLLLCACGVGCGTPSSDGPAGSFGVDFSLPPGSPTRGCVIFLVDGVNAELFQQMLESGELPSFKKYFADRGLYAPRAVANTPTVTLPNLVAITTGTYPGHTGIVGINWFDRNQLIWRNYDSIAQKNELDHDYLTPTIYEYFPDRTTMSLFFQPHRGVTKFFENWTSAGPPFFFGWYEFVDRITLYRFQEAMAINRYRGSFAAVTIVYQLCTDFRAYEGGISSPLYRQAIQHADRQIGRVLGDMERAGLLKDVNIVMTSDHGMDDVRQHLVLHELLERAGLDISEDRLWEKTPFEKRMAAYEKHAAVLYGSGDRFWAVCLRRPIVRDGRCVGFEPWPQRPRPEDLFHYPTRDKFADLPALLCSQEGIDAVAYRMADRCVRVRRAAGEVEFCQSGGPGTPITCRVLTGSDPLQWCNVVPEDVLAGRRALTPRQWLETTARSCYPDLPQQILAYFDSRRAGDIAIFASEGWDFRGVHKGGHGGLRSVDMHVPLLMAGPGIPHCRPEVARTVDVLPTLLDVMGKPIPAGIDGVSLVRPGGQTRGGGDAETRRN